MVDCRSAVAFASPVMFWVISASCWEEATATESIEPTFADAEASIGAATLALAATAPSIGAARFSFPSRFTLTLSRLPSSGPDVAAGAAAAVVPAASGAAVVASGAAAPVWSIELTWGACAVALPVMPWSIDAPWCATASAAEPAERMFAPTDASIGAAAFAFAATPRSIGAAASSAMLRSALRSSSDMTSLSGRAAPVSAASSSGESGLRSSVLTVVPSSGHGASVPLLERTVRGPDQPGNSRFTSMGEFRFRSGRPARDSGADEHRDADAGHRPEPAGERADDEPFGRCGSAQLRVPAEPLHREDDGEPLGPAGEQGAGDRAPLERADPGTPAQDLRVLRAADDPRGR